MSFLVLPHFYSLSNHIIACFSFRALRNAFSSLLHLSHPSHNPLPHSLPQASSSDVNASHRAVWPAKPTTYPHHLEPLLAGPPLPSNLSQGHVEHVMSLPPKMAQHSYKVCLPTSSFPSRPSVQTDVLLLYTHVCI